MKLIRPVMLNYDGTVAYELDHDDQTKTVDGYNSDISDEDFNGNAMVEFPKMYFARWTDSDGKHSHVRISNIQLPDEVDSAGKSVASYHCYAHNTGGGSWQLIPTMTSNTTPSGVASCSDAWFNMDAWTAFRHATSGWHPSDVAGNFAPGHWVQYQFERPVTFNLVKEGAYSSNVIASPTFDIKISNDGVSFTTIGQIQHINGAYQQTKFDKLYTCEYIRFEFAQNYGYSNNAGGFDFQVIDEELF